MKKKENRGILGNLEKNIEKEIKVQKSNLRDKENVGNKDLIVDIAYELVNLGKNLNVESIFNALTDKKVSKKVKQKILLLLGIPFEGEIEKILRLPEIKEKIEQNVSAIKEEISKLKEEDFEEKLIKKYLKEIENYLVGVRSDKEQKNTGYVEGKVNYSPSKKFYVKETIKSFIKGERKFYSKLNREYKKENIIFLLDFSSSMAGDKIKDLKKYVFYCWIKNERKIKRIITFADDVEETTINKLLLKHPKGLTDIGKCLSKISKEIKGSIVYLITDNIPTIGDEKKILDAVNELNTGKNRLIIILLKPSKESILLAKKMSDKVLVLENNYFKQLLEVEHFLNI